LFFSQSSTRLSFAYYAYKENEHQEAHLEAKKYVDQVIKKLFGNTLAHSVQSEIIQKKKKGGTFFSQWKFWIRGFFNLTYSLS
jgi:hypothetical protein